MRLIRKSLIYFLLALYRLSFAQNPVYIVPDSVICWDEKVKLQWNDFKGTPDTSTLYEAVTDSYILLVSYYNVKLRNVTYKVLNRFRKNTSWSKDTSSWYAPYLLRHEQLHFDITELYARKIRCEIFKIDSINSITSGNLKLYSESIKKLLNDKKEETILYDKETDHGTKNTKQQEWIVKVHSNLNKLKKYASTKDDCSILRDDDE